jgi:AbrB family looped-hinge helix DNA binding protein
MEINLMPVVKIRPKGQVTIPAEILQAWQIHSNDKINVNLVNGVVGRSRYRGGKTKTLQIYKAGDYFEKKLENNP